VLGFTPGAVLACACGCDVFDVGTATMLPSRPGGIVFIEDDYMNQNENWVGSHSAPAALNTDKEIQTHFGGLGLDYQFDSRWGASLKIPYWDRILRTDIGTPSAPDVASFRHSGLGDVRLMGRFTGFSPDLATGVALGIKFATGDWTYPHFDRDTSIGTGTTDLLVGGYHVGTLSYDAHLKWFGEALYDRAFNSRDGYRPGNELDIAVGTLYDGFRIGSRAGLVALLQVLASNRLRDTGVNADPYNSGYQRLLLSPGAEVSIDHWKVYGDVEFLIYNYANAAPSVATVGTQGQLVAPWLVKFMISYQW